MLYCLKLWYELLSLFQDLIKLIFSSTLTKSLENIFFSLGNLLRTLAWWLECLPMAWETGIQSQVESYQRLNKWYLMPPCLTLSIIRYRSRVKWSNPGKGVAPSLTPWCSSYRKRSLRVTLDYDRQLYFTYLVGSSCSVLVRVLDCSLELSKVQLCYCTHFQTNTLEKGMNPLPTIGWIVPLLFFCKDGFGIK